MMSEKIYTYTPYVPQPLGILNDAAIDYLATKHGMIEPYSPEKVRRVEDSGFLSYGQEPFGYTLRLAAGYKRPIKTGRIIYAGITDYNYIDETAHHQHDKEWIVILPGSFVLCRSVEKIDMPPDVQAQALTKSTIARVGGFANITGIEPVWRGYLTIEYSNLGPNPLALAIGEGCCQVFFTRGETPRKGYEGNYQDQGPLPTPAKV